MLWHSYFTIHQSRRNRIRGPHPCATESDARGTLWPRLHNSCSGTEFCFVRRFFFCTKDFCFVQYQLSGSSPVLSMQTGSGKTLAYLLPLFTRINPSRAAVQALVVVPTRELGMQVLRNHSLRQFPSLRSYGCVCFLSMYPCRLQHHNHCLCLKFCRLPK